MRVDFYQLSRDPVTSVVPLLADKTLGAGERLLVVSAEPAQLAAIGDALWAREGFLAHGLAGDAHEARQPVLLADGVAPANGAKFMALADGIWREAGEGIERVFLLFGDDRLTEARACWKSLGEREGLTRHFWKQQGARWVQAA